MFKRRIRSPIRYQVRDLMWPRIGWRRSTRYLAHRVGRMPGTPYSIAAGFACGVFFAMTPFMGFHFPLAAAFAWLLGGSLLASALGTLVGNVWTFPAIWYASYRIGYLVIGNSPGDAAPEQVTVGFLLGHPMQALLPMSIGGLILGAVAWPIAFLTVRPVVAAYQNRRRQRRARFRSVKGEGRSP